MAKKSERASGAVVLEKIQMVYAGIRESTVGEELYQWYHVLPDGSLGKSGLWTKKKGLGGYSVGALVEVEGAIAEDGMSIAWSTAHFLRKWEGEEVMQWSASNIAARASLEAKRLKKAMKDPLHEALEPVREMYARAVGRHKTAILAEVVRYVTGG